MSARALVVQHAGVEHAGRFAGWWSEAGLQLEHVRPFAGDAIPVTAAGYDAVVVLGGPQSVCRADGGVDPAELELVRRVAAEGPPFLGICLGAQVLAAACGGAVAPGPAPEHGVGQVRLTAAAAADPLLRVVGPGEQPVVQWHGDGVTALPADAQLLATSEAYPVQAFRVGATAWGFQFHAEADEELVGAWAAADGVAFDALRGPLRALDLEPVWRPVAEAFAVLAGATGRVAA